MFAVCRRMLGTDADAADAAQEALIAMSRGLARFDGRSRVSTWAYRIAVNCSIDEMRRRSRMASARLEDLGEDLAPGGHEPLDAVADRADIDAALTALPVEFRAPVVLRDLCGLDYAEIAEVLGVPPGTVRSRIARGRAGLARLLAPTRTEP
jgi:RNA polymerase sigma-70 factor (ECF subfamily)